MIFLGVIGVVFLLFAEFFVSLLTDDPGVVAVGAECLRVLSYGYLVYALGMVMVQAFNGAGDTTTPTVINFFCFWLIEIPLAYLLALPLGLDERGVFFAILASETVLGIAGAIMFRRGRWKSREV